ncbi:NUDIX hydrolase [Niabella terrae]
MATDMNWKTLDSKLLFDELWFKVRQERCETPKGKIVDPYYVYDFPTWVTCFAMTEEGQVILERQYRHAIGATCWEIPGGCVDEEDPDLETAIRRELQEETGYSFQDMIYLGKTCANPSTNSNWMHMFLGKGGRKTAEQDLDPNEEIEIALFSMEEFLQLFRSNTFIQSMHVTCMTYALMELGLLKV